MIGNCENCGRNDIAIHPVKSADDSGVSSMNICTPCDEYGQGLMTEEEWRILVGKPYHRFLCKNCGHYQFGSDCDDMNCEVCNSCDWSPR